MAAKTMIVALCGLQGAGKDTLASVLVQHHGFTRLSFAATLKDVVSSLFDWDRALLEGVTPQSRQWRETVDDWWSRRLGIPDLTPRKALQVVGTDLFRKHFDHDIWVACLERKMAGHKHIVITDCRFPNEVSMVRRAGGRLVHVFRPPLPAWFIAYRRGELQSVPSHIHASEFAWAREQFDVCISNEGRPEDMASRLLCSKCKSTA
jgi:hypothetical protein